MLEIGDAQENLNIFQANGRDTNGVYSVTARPPRVLVGWAFWYIGRLAHKAYSSHTVSRGKYGILWDYMIGWKWRTRKRVGEEYASESICT